MYDDEKMNTVSNENDIAQEENTSFHEEDSSIQNEDIALEKDSVNNEESIGTESQNMSEKDYKENIKRMKAEYKLFLKEQKQAAKEAQKNEDLYSEDNVYTTKKRSIGAGATILISLLSSFVIFVVIFALLAFFPSKDRSFLAGIYNGTSSFFSEPGRTNNPSGNDIDIGGGTVSKGDNVTINVYGEEEIAAAVYAKAANSVVGIAVSRIGGNKWNPTETTVSMGSGVIYSGDGIIITNHHVIEAALDKSGNISSSAAIRVYFKTDLTEWSYVTEIIGTDAANDIAVLRVDAKNLQPIEFANSDTLTTGETVVAIGSPGGITFMNSVSEGILSGINRTITTENNVVYDLLQTTAAINPGNSGGALLNKEGKLIGICVIKISSTDYEGMGFAINSNTTKTIVESILEYGYYNKPLFGITVNTTYTPDIAQDKGWETGAYIEDVSKNSAADKAGIKQDDIITKINDKNINSFDALRRILLDCRPGDKINVEIYRTGTSKTFTVEVTLDETPKP